MSFRFFFKQLFIILSVSLIFTNNSLSQPYPRLGNPQYTHTVFTEDFSSDELDREEWRVTANMIKSDLYIFTDTITTVYQTERGLGLGMRRHPAYTTKVWTAEGDSIVEAEFIAGEVSSKKDFSYGIFECSATFAHGRGSFPAFWLYNDTMCFESERPEIDIVELKVNRRNPTLDNNIWYYPVDCLPQTSHEFAQHDFEWGGTHVFTGIWTPEKIEFLVDGILLKEVYNDGQYWYPSLKQHVILSQQISRYGRLLTDTARIETPQTSWFHWVRVREFFLAPEINCPDDVRETVVATLDVDPAATDITWELVPESLFSGPSNGNGKNISVTPASGFHGLGKIYFRFKMPSGETFYAEKEIRLNGLY